MKYLELKNQIKEDSAQIKELRIYIKEKTKTEDTGSKLFTKQALSVEVRHLLIAYGLLRGKTYEQIESKVKDNNEPLMNYVRGLMSKYESKNVCVDQK